MRAILILLSQVPQPIDVPWAETLQIIAPYAFAAALVGLLESLMTAKLVDDITDTRSRKTREAWGPGVANIASACFGGTGGCDLSRTHVWDASTVAALDAIVTKYEQRGTTVALEGMSDAAASFHGRLSGGLGSA